MTAHHTIRLHAAWKRMVDSGDSSSVAEVTVVSLPDVALRTTSGLAVTYRRTFNRPTGLSSTDSVSFLSDLLPIADSIWFNDHQVAIPSQPILELGDRLRAHNELVLRIPGDRFGQAADATATLRITPQQ